VGRAVETCLNRSLRPRKWFRDHYGPHRASMKLSALLHQLDTKITPSPRSDWGAPRWCRSTLFAGSRPRPRH
jgi:hypothetical protein